MAVVVFLTIMATCRGREVALECEVVADEDAILG